MDTMFIWIVAGAAIGLLGIFLVASERELKSKRHELEELKHKLADGPASAISNAFNRCFSTRKWSIGRTRCQKRRALAASFVSIEETRGKREQAGTARNSSCTPK